MTARRRRAAPAPSRTLTREEARAYLDHPISQAEREEVLAVARWFRRRYPTPAERLAYVRRAYARWQRTAGTARRTSRQE